MFVFASKYCKYDGPQPKFRRRLMSIIESENPSDYILKFGITLEFENMATFDIMYIDFEHFKFR